MSLASLSNLASPSILVVDDNPENLNIALTFLAHHQFEMAVATDGSSTLESLKIITPQLILLDVMLPDMSGFELCKKLKTEPRLSEIPVIFMTALDEPQYKVQGFEAGGVDYVTKPLERLELLARVDNHLRIHQQAQILQTANHNLQRANQTLQQQNRSVTENNRKLQQLVHIDGLTQVGNRRCFDERLNQEWLRLRRERMPLSLILFDIDYFKAYNDRYGHPAGDTCLAQIAQAVKRLLKRPGDLLTRYGGEEFAVILPNVDAAGALYVADRIQTEIARLEIHHESSCVSPYVTVSQGVSTCMPLVSMPPAKLVQTADQALYLAKQQGRNQSVHRSKSTPQDYSASPSSVNADQSEGLA